MVAIDCGLTSNCCFWCGFGGYVRLSHDACAIHIAVLCFEKRATSVQSSTIMACHGFSSISVALLLTCDVLDSHTQVHAG